MARQILKQQQQYVTELAKVEKKKEQKLEDATNELKKENKAFGNERLGQILTHKMFQRDIEGSSKFRKI